MKLGLYACFLVLLKTLFPLTQLNKNIKVWHIPVSGIIYSGVKMNNSLYNLKFGLMRLFTPLFEQNLSLI